MITVTERALVALGFNTESPLGSVQIVRELITSDGAAKVMRGKGVDLINQLLGTSITFNELTDGVQPQLVADWELMTTQAVAEAVVRAHGQTVDEVDLLTEAKSRVRAMMTAPRHSWMFAKPEKVAESASGVALIADVDVKVEVKADGSLKKGGAQVLAAELYRVRVIESGKPVTNQEFVKMLTDEVGMTKAGATTYAYNIDKQHGGKLVKKQRGQATA